MRFLDQPVGQGRTAKAILKLAIPLMVHGQTSCRHLPGLVR
jgi:hypothetical protein